jgi:Flp pilus assembly protein TadD
MTNQAEGQMPDRYVVPDPKVYFEQKQSAIALVRAQQWEKALPLLQNLTQQYKNDGETWYLLGLSYFNLQQWQQALAPLKQALNLGYRLEKIPTGESNPNDLMVKIAKTYA